MAENKLADLRNILFEQLERLKNAEQPDSEIKRAEAVSEVATTILATARVELDFLKMVGQELLPPTVDAAATARFLEMEADPRTNPKAKGLGTGKNLGGGR